MISWPYWSWSKFFRVFTLIGFCAGCNVSFHSNQISFISDLIKQREFSSPRDWRAEWLGESTQVFAVNHDSGIVFANNDGFLVSFDGWQIVEISMNEDSGYRKRIFVNSEPAEKGEGFVLVFLDEADRKISEHFCGKWVAMTDTSQSAPESTERIKNGWNQTCVSSSGKFINTIMLDQQSKVVALEFFIGPDDRALKIAL